MLRKKWGVDMKINLMCNNIPVISTYTALLAMVINDIHSKLNI